MKTTTFLSLYCGQSLNPDLVNIKYLELYCPLSWVTFYPALGIFKKKL